MNAICVIFKVFSTIRDDGAPSCMCFGTSSLPCQSPQATDGKPWYRPTWPNHAGDLIMRLIDDQSINKAINQAMEQTDEPNNWLDARLESDFAIFTPT